MPQQTYKPGIRLPPTLLEEINEASGKGKRKNDHKTSSRKDLRKQQRQDLKARKADHFSRTSDRPQSWSQTKRALPHDEDDTSAPVRKKAKISNLPRPTTPATPSTTSAKKHTSLNLRENNLARPVKKKTALQQLAERTDPTIRPSSARSQREREDDAYIGYLESKLGWRKSGKKTSKYGSGLGDDGLDDLLGGLDDLEVIGIAKAGVREESDAEDTLSVDEEDISEEESEDSEAPDLLGPDEESSEEANFNDEDGDDTEEWGGIQDASEDEDSTQSNVPEAVFAGIENRYIPPALRNRLASGDAHDSEELAKLNRQIKGQLNRLSEQNISSILDSIEEIYRKHRRHDVSSTITTLIIEGISSHAVLLDSYVVLYAAFVSALHKILGLEFGAFFIQTLVESYERHYATLSLSHVDADDTVDVQSAGGKESSNLLVLLTELYNFQVISCVLIYDIIRTLLEGELREYNVELLLKLTRNSGQQLRQDDPSALKDIVQSVQTKVAGKQDSLSSRTRFMLETLTNIKNNKIKKTTPGNAGQTGGNEAVERMKKFLIGLGKQGHVLAHEPLRVSLQDLHTAGTKGKWWLVGAAWGGDPLVDHQAEAPEQRVLSTTEAVESKLLKLARKQGMNTDVRRSIFVVLMSSDDYIDACERLAQLNLTEIQQREVVRVILHCCGNEKVYNPYYTLVIQHLCSLSHSYKITLQFCLWDFLRELGETNVGGAEVIKNLKHGDNDNADFGSGKRVTDRKINSLARAYGWWVAKGQLTLAILKPVDFTTLKPRSQTFLHSFLQQVFVSTQLANPIVASTTGVPRNRNHEAIEEVFIKAARIPALAMGLVYFFGKAYNIHDEAEEDSEGRTAWLRWASDVARETLRAGIDVIPGL